MKIQEISSRDNPTIKAIKKLAQSNTHYKSNAQIWLEGEHLCEAFLLARSLHKTPLALSMIVLSQSVSQHWCARLNAFSSDVIDVVVLPDTLWAQISGLSSSEGLGFVVDLAMPVLATQSTEIQKTVSTVVLDRVQDAGNVGSILRSAAALGVQQVLALRGTAALWSPKVLRAGMGAHFALRLTENLSLDEIQLDVPMLATNVHVGDFLHVVQSQKRLPNPCAWIFGHEGQGISQALLDKASQQVRIYQTGQESLNVAAAAAICLFASAASSAC